MDENDRDKGRQAIAKAAELQKERKKAAELEAAKAKEKATHTGSSSSSSTGNGAQPASNPAGGTVTPVEPKSLPAVLGGVAVGMGVAVRDQRCVSRATRVLRERAEGVSMSPGEWWEESLLAPCNDGLAVSDERVCVCMPGVRELILPWSDVCHTCDVCFAVFTTF